MVAQGEASAGKERSFLGQKQKTPQVFPEGTGSARFLSVAVKVCDKSWDHDSYKFKL